MKVLFFFVFYFLFIFCDDISIKIQIINQAPINGANLTPVWVGFHDGSFDTFSPDDNASEALERLAEDGNTTFISELFLNTDKDFMDGIIYADFSSEPVIQYGQTATEFFIINSEKHKFVSFLSQVVPSNDAFIGNSDRTAYPLFNNDTFENIIITWEGNDVWDAGTEVNDEIPENTNFYGQIIPNTGVTENSVITIHPGLKPKGSGGIVDQPQFVNADFSTPGYLLTRISVDFLFINEIYVSYSEPSETTIASGNTIYHKIFNFPLICCIILIYSILI